MKKRLICFIILVMLIVIQLTPASLAVDAVGKYNHAIDCATAEIMGISNSTPDIVAFDLSTERIIADSNITKSFVIPKKAVMLMVALIAARNLKTNEITVGTDCITDTNNNVLGLKEGMSVNVNDLLAATVLYDDVNAAKTLALGVSDSTDSFVKSMNSLAFSLGMKNTKFTNLSGEYDKNQVTTLEDITAMVYNCCSYSSIIDITSSSTYYIKTSSIYSANKTLKNNFLLIDENSDSYNDKVYGIGFDTGNDGITTTFTLAKSADEKYIIISRTSDQSYYNDVSKAVDYISTNFSLVDISNIVYQLADKASTTINGQQVGFTTAKNSVKNSQIIVSSYYSKAVSVMSERYSVKLPSTMPSAVNVGDKVSGFEIYYNDTYVTTVDMIVKSVGENIGSEESRSYTIYEKNDTKQNVSFMSKHGWVIILAAVTLICAAIIVFVSKIRKV